MQTLHFPEICLEAGGLLRDVDVAYETYGTLNEEGTNAVLVCHALTGDTRAYSAEQSNGWWQGLIGPGLALDPERHFIICSNVIGGCSGSTGPQSTDPETGLPYGSRFPLVTIHDMVEVQYLLLRVLGVKSLELVIGGSMGGLQVIEWAVSYPRFVQKCMPIATSARLSALAIAYNDVMRHSITGDPDWREGNYYDTRGPVRGLTLARKVGMITYRTYDLFEDRFGHEIADEQAPLAKTRFQMESYLDYQGEKLAKRFDANSYLCLLKAMDLHDIGRGRGGLEAAIDRIVCDMVWVGIDSDRLYPMVEQRMWAEQIEMQGKSIVYREIQSFFGHDAFLLEFEQINAIVREFLGV